MNLEDLIIEGCDKIAIYNRVADDSSAKKGIISCSKSMVKKYTSVLVKLIGKKELEKELENSGLGGDYSDDMGFNYEDHSLVKGYSLADWKKDQQTEFDDWKKAIEKKPKTTQRVFTTKKSEPAPKPAPKSETKEPTKEYMLEVCIAWLKKLDKNDIKKYYEHFKKK